MILLGIGGNLPGKYGSPEQAIEAAKGYLECAGIKIVAASRIWVTEPVPKSDQPWYRNAVFQVETALSPEDILAEIAAIEKAFGRERNERDAARIIDIDLLAYHDQVMSAPDLHIPHPRMHQRGFVLYPLRDITRDWAHPVLQKNVCELIAMLPDDYVASPSRETENAA